MESCKFILLFLKKLSNNLLAIAFFKLTPVAGVFLKYDKCLIDIWGHRGDGYGPKLEAYILQTVTNVWRNATSKV